MYERAKNPIGAAIAWTGFFPVPVSVKQRMPNYDAYLDRSPEASYGITAIFLHSIFVVVH